MRYRVPMQREANLLTVNPTKRRSDVLGRHIDNLHAVMKTVKDAHKFSVLAIVMLPEHLHAIRRLPPGEADYSLVALVAHQCQFLAAAGNRRACQPPR